MEESSSSASYHSCSPGGFFYKEKGVFMDRSKGKMEGHRAVGVAVDFSPRSKKALQWAVDNLVHKGDSLILVNVQASVHYEEGETQLWEATGSLASLRIEEFFIQRTNGGCGEVRFFIRPLGVKQSFPSINLTLIPLNELTDTNIEKKYGVKPDAETLDILKTVAAQKEIVVVMKVFWGDVRDKICEAIESIPLSCLVMGSRGPGRIKRAILGWVSNYVVNNGTCPVTVVKSNHHE